MTGAAWSGAASFAACLQLFRLYPLAVTQRSAAVGLRSMVLMKHAAPAAGLFVLAQPGEDLFVIRAWNGHNWVSEEIRREEPVSRVTRQAVAGGIPVPRDGALLGWVSDSQVTALLSVHYRRREAEADQVFAPEIRVMPSAGASDPRDWPPFAASPLGDGRLWEYVERGLVVDIAPLVVQRGGHAFWVPSPDRQGVRYGKGCVVITGNLLSDEYWVPAGVYLDHWNLREGIKAPPAQQLLALSGTVDLARSLRKSDPVVPGAVAFGSTESRVELR